ncbi:MAG: PAS domain-containing protein, partial [Rhodomicrobiaceae bacterium]
MALRTTLSLCLNSSFPTAIYWGPDLCLLYNDSWAPIPAEKHPWALGRPAREVWPDIWQVIEPQFQNVLRTGAGFSTYDQMLPMKRGDGIHETYWNYSFTPIRDLDGSIAGIFNQGNETTGRMTTERALRESQAELKDALGKFQALTDSIDQMIWSTRPDGFHDYFNQRWYEYTGVSKGATDGEEWNGMFHPDDQERAWERWRHSLETGEPYHIEYRLRHHSGVYRWVLGRGQPVLDEQGRIRRWFGTCTDIQEIVDAREILARSHEDLERQITERTDELMRAEEQLRQSQKMEAIGRLTGGIAHDFNNMLAVVIGGLNLLERRIAQGDPNIGKYIDGAKDGAQRAAALTQRLLAFSRQQPLSPRPLNPVRLINGMLEILTRTLGERIEIVNDTMKAVWPVNVDPVQLENALLNLAVNSRDAMPDGGTLTIETVNAEITKSQAGECGAAPGEFVVITVSDSGEGMTSDVLEKAFDPFFTTKSVGKGTGLGLSQVFGFVRQSGGFVTIRSQPGAGTNVSIHLPRYAGEALPGDDADNAPAMVYGSKDEIVLVVEDDERVLNFSVEALRELGYTALATRSPAEALGMIENGQGVSLLFADVVMPGMTGPELAERATSLKPGLKVLFTSGYADETFDGNGRLDTTGNFLAKPFSLDQLAAKVREA